MKGLAAIIAVLFLILFLVVLGGAFYTVDETEQVVVTQFGKPVGDAKTDPGLYFKLPIIQDVNRFHKNLVEWDGEAGEVPTVEKTLIRIDTFARWRIVDPLLFFKTLKAEIRAQSRLDDIIDAEVRNLIAENPLHELVRSTDHLLGALEEEEAELEEELRTLETVRKPPVPVKIGRAGIELEIERRAREKLKVFGIDLIDVRIKRVNYHPGVQASVFNRMISERERIATFFRAQGEREAKRIRGQAERKTKEISSKAYREAQEIRGAAEAEATRITVDAYGQDPEFYSFWQTLKLYKATIGKDSTLVLSTDSDFLKYLKSFEEKRR